MMVTKHLCSKLIRMHEDFTRRANPAALVVELGIARTAGVSNSIG
jgi:hypothetical protein